jgi:ABC-type thiamin/hydroxymethylpyrimidine transport system permease subunit
MTWLFCCILVFVAAAVTAALNGRWGTAVLCSAFVFGFSVWLVTLISENRGWRPW